MSQLKQALHNDVQALEMIRDELALQAHLFKADAKDRWSELETRWDQLKHRLGAAKRAAACAEPKIDAAAEQLLDALKAGYAELKNALRK